VFHGNFLYVMHGFRLGLRWISLFCDEIYDRLWGYIPPKSMFSPFAKGTSLCQDASFDLSTIKMSLNVRLVELRKIKGNGREGKEREEVLRFEKVQQLDGFSHVPRGLREQIVTTFCT